ncbi:MAG: CRISPR-associated endonuclease Cas2 [Deltaproteobacteria bacterium]|nr:CRISPR-associated endonuclease Cas2 [Deltaproteobacteria bacterium]
MEVVQQNPVETAEPFGPAQFNLLTGQAELIPIEVPEPPDLGKEVRIDEGISVVKSEDGSQLILSGFGLFLSKKSERLLVRKGKEVIYQFPLFRLHEVVIGSKGITVSSDLLEELRTLVIYDIEDDKIRLKISETCLDYGLVRIQYSAFLGTLNRNKREELFLKLCSLLGDNPGKILLQPVCDKDVKDVLVQENERPDEPEVL